MDTKTEFEVLNDGVLMDVIFTAGGTEEVKVRKVPVRHLDKLGRVWGKESQEVEIYTQKDSDWVESLSDDSFTVVIEEGRRLNFTSFGKWFKRQEQTLEAMGQSAMIQKAMDRAVEQASQNPSSS